MHVACKYGLVFNPEKMHVKAPAVNFFSCLYDADGVYLDPDKVCTCPANANKCHQTPGVLRHGNVPKFLHPWPVHLDCPSA